MTRTTDEVVKPLPGQMAFGFMHAGSGPAERLEPEQEGRPSCQPKPPGSTRRGRSLKKGPGSRRPGSVRSGDAVDTDEDMWPRTFGRRDA
jgi:hypothetical protein